MKRNMTVSKWDQSRFQRSLSGVLILLACLGLYWVYVYENVKSNEAEKVLNDSQSDRIYGKYSNQQGYNGVVASENVICSKMGVEILKAGGSAVDTIITTGLCIGTINMQSSGIGGGGFLVARNNKDRTFFNFREKAPKLSYTDMFKKNPKDAQVGGLAVGVPGELRGYDLAHQKYGTLPWADLVRPVIDLARRGWIVNSVFAKRISSYEEEILKDPVLQRVLAPNGTILKEGDWMSRPVFANTLESIANNGVDVFYNGWIATELVKTIKEKGGIMTMEDFQEYTATQETPLVGTYRGMNIVTAPPPASGAVLLSVLNILEHFNMTENSPLNYHRLMEAFKHGFSQRGFYGDPVDPIYRNISQITRHFIDKNTAADIAKKIFDNTTFPVEYYKPEFKSVDNHGTMHVSVLTKDGQAASLTSTVNLILGARIMDNATGIILNDEMDDFSIPGVSNAFGLAPSPYNYVHPGKRPLSSSVPTIVEQHGQVVAVAGASGGSHIITSTLQTLIKMLDRQMKPYDAIHDPRGHHQLLPHSAWVEFTTPKSIVQGLLERSHQVIVAEEGVSSSGVSAVKRLDDGLILGAGDHRKLGMAIGY